MVVLKNLFYGIISGLSAFLPISSRGHQGLFRALFGISHADPLLDLMVHVALVAVAVFSARSTLDGFRKDFRDASRRGRHRRSSASIARTYELRLLMTAAIPMLAMLLIWGNRSDASALWLGVWFIINGIILFVPDYLLQSNKDAGKMAGIDGILIGIFSGLSAIPGISGIGAGMSMAVARGAEKKHAYNWMIILSIPALIVLCFFDAIAIFAASRLSVTAVSIISYLCAMIGAFISGYAAVMIMRFLTVRISNSGFAYYSWGVSMLIFILYLIT